MNRRPRNLWTRFRSPEKIQTPKSRLDGISDDFRLHSGTLSWRTSCREKTCEKCEHRTPRTSQSRTSASATELERWAERVLTAESLDEVLN